MTPDRTFAAEVMAMNLVPCMRSLQKLDVTFAVTFHLQEVRREGALLVAKVGSDYGGVTKHRRVDHVVVNHGTVPNEELYFDLKPGSRNRGALDHERLFAGLAQPADAHPAGSYSLFRVGDAIAAHNTHAAIYDAFRLLKDL